MGEQNEKKKKKKIMKQRKERKNEKKEMKKKKKSCGEVSSFISSSLVSFVAEQLGERERKCNTRGMMFSMN